MIRRPVVEREPGWGRGDSLLRPDLLLFWISLFLLVIGASFMQAWFGSVALTDAGAGFLMLIGWSLYVVPLVAVIVALDLHEPEPPAFMAAAFGWGFLAAVPITVAANESLRTLMQKRLDDAFVRDWYSALVGPWTEEPVKALGLVIIVGLAARQITTVVDGLVYGALIGLGFQVAENIVGTIDDVLDVSAGRGALVVDYWLWRGLGQGLWSHAVYTAIVGAAVAYAVNASTSRGRRTAVCGLGLLAACALHFFWNAPWWNPDHDQPVAAAVIYVVKGLPALALVIVLAVVARAREVEWFAPALDGQLEVTAEESATLRTWHGRRRARAAARSAGGRRGRAAARRLQSAQVRLAVALATDRTDADVDLARHGVRTARAELDAACGSGLRPATHPRAT